MAVRLSDLYSSPDLDSSPDLSPFLLDLDLGSKDLDLDLKAMDLDLEVLPASPFSSPLYFCSGG